MEDELLAKAKMVLLDVLGGIKYLTPKNVNDLCEALVTISTLQATLTLIKENNGDDSISNC